MTGLEPQCPWIINKIKKRIVNDNFSIACVQCVRKSLKNVKYCVFNSRRTNYDRCVWLGKKRTIKLEKKKNYSIGKFLQTKSSHPCLICALMILVYFLFLLKDKYLSWSTDYLKSPLLFIHLHFLSVSYSTYSSSTLSFSQHIKMKTFQEPWETRVSICDPIATARIQAQMIHHMMISCGRAGILSLPNLDIVDAILEMNKEMESFTTKRASDVEKR